MLPNRYTQDKQHEIINKAEQEVREKVLPLIPDFKEFELYNIKNIQHLGKYVAGSYKKPIICVSYNSCQKAADYYEIDIYTTILTTILHELAHAIQESRGKKFDEEEAESLPKNYIHNGLLPEWVADISPNKPKQVFIKIKD